MRVISSVEAFLFLISRWCSGKTESEAWSAPRFAILGVANLASYSANLASDSVIPAHHLEIKNKNASTEKITRMLQLNPPTEYTHTVITRERTDWPVRKEKHLIISALGLGKKYDEMLTDRALSTHFHLMF